MKPRILLLILLSLPLFSIAQKTTVLKSRMTGACFRIAASSTIVYINDSDVYTYSGYNTGAVKNTGSPIAISWNYSGKYDTLTRRKFDTTASHLSYYLRDRTFNHYTSGGLADTTVFQTYDTASTAMAFKSRYRTVYVYNSGNDLIWSSIQGYNSVTSSYHDSVTNAYTYDGSHNMQTDTFRNLFNATSNRLFLYHYTSNYLDTQVNMNWNTTSSMFINSTRTVYCLNSTTHKSDSTLGYQWSTTSSTWNMNTRNYYIYSGGNLVTDTNRNLFGGTWYLGTVNNYTYNAGGDMASDTQYQNFGTFRYYYYWVNSYDPSHNLTTSEKYTWLTSSSSWRDTAMYTTTYNGYNQATMYLTQTKIGGTWVMTRIGGGGGYSDVLNYYYYSTYNDPTGVSNTVKYNNNGSLKLYPVPANNMLNIDLNWDNAQSATLAIYDMTGRVYMQWHADNTTNYKNTIYTSQLPAGNYIMKARGERDELTQPFVIVK